MSKKTPALLLFQQRRKYIRKQAPGQHQVMHDIIFTFICLFARYILSLHNNALKFYTK